MKADRLLDVVAVALGNAVDERQVFLLDAAKLELESELVMDALVLGDDQEAGRVAIEAVDDPGPILAGERREPVEVELERVDQRAAPVSPRGVRDHSRRLVDDGQMLVVVDDLDREVFGLGRRIAAARADGSRSGRRAGRGTRP